MIEAGYAIYKEAEPNNRFDFNKDTNTRGAKTVNTKHMNNRTQLSTFGKVPYVYYAGETNFVEFNLSTVFHYNHTTGETARSQVDRFKELVDERGVLVVENSQGQKFYCDVNITGETAPELYVEKDMDYIEIDVKCVQIDY